MHRPCVPPRDSKRFLAFPLALALSLFLVQFAPLSLFLKDVRVRISRARTPTECVSLSPMQEKIFAEKSTHVPRRPHVCTRTFDVSWTASDRIRLYRRYHKSTMRLGLFSIFRRVTHETGEFANQRALSMIYYCQLRARSSPAWLLRLAILVLILLNQTMKITSVPHLRRIECELNVRICEVLYGRS